MGMTDVEEHALKGGAASIEILATPIPLASPISGLSRSKIYGRLAAGVPMGITAVALGNSEVICAKHYAHLSSGYIAHMIREHAGGMGIVPLETGASNAAARRSGERFPQRLSFAH